METNINHYDINSLNDYNINPQSEFDKLYFGKAPKIGDKKTMVIGVIDASGSMSSLWPTLVEEWNLLVGSNFENTITTIFSSRSRVVEGKYLQKSDVGGGTDICKGFETVYNVVKSLPEEKDFTLIFVSDGDDGNMQTIKERLKNLTKPEGVNINLICVGVGPGFPTFVGMELRERYHNGLSSIPAVFLVSDWANEFASTFSDIKNQFLLKLELCRVMPKVKQFPWQNQEEIEFIFESSNFISSQTQIKINNKKVDTQTCREFTKSQLEEIFRSWTQELQLMSIKTSVRSEAKIVVELMEYLYKIYDDKINMSFNNDKSKKLNLTVLERLEIREKKSGTHLLQSLIGECKKIQEGVSLKDLSAEEAAKRLAIGTKQGKYHQKALHMRGLDDSQYLLLKEDFLNRLEKNKLNLATTQEPSFILLQTQKEVLLETTLATAIGQLNSFELVEVFPMVGHTLLIRRSDQSMINPYSIHVISIPRINKICDTVSLVSQGNEMEISIGHDEEEKFNAILPLFDESDNDIRHLIRSKLFHLLMTFNVMRNVDTFFYEAYAGLLANTFLRLLKYPDSEWKTTMINLVCTTTEMVYEKSPAYEFSVRLLLIDPRGAMVTEHKTEKHKCEDISKMLLNMLVLKKRGLLTEEECRDRIRYMLIEHVGRNIKEGTNVLEAYLGDEKITETEFRLTKKDNKNMKNISDSNKKNGDNSSNQNKNGLEENQKNKSVLNSNTNIIDINSPQPFDLNTNSVDNNKDSSKENYNEKDINKIVERFIKNREHMKFDSIRDLRTNLKKVFLEFLVNTKSDNQKNIRIVNDTFNKPGYRINFSVFYDIHDNFCPKLPSFDSKNFLIAVNHALKFNNSHDRSVNDIDFNYDLILQNQKKKYFEKNEKEENEKLYDSFEKPIIKCYLSDFKNAMTMVKDFKCTTDLLKINAHYIKDKPFVNVIFIGPYQTGKSSLIGRLMKQFNCVDDKLFDYYKTAYKTFNPSHENDPYEWICNTSVDERVKNRTMGISVLHLNLENKLVNLYDTPGKYQYYKHTINAMALVNHFFLCVEADIEKIKQEIEIIKNTFPSLISNGCGCAGNKLFIVLTKTEKYEGLDQTINHIKNIFEDLLIKLKIKIEFEIIPVNAYNGYNIDQLAIILDGLNPVVQDIKKDDDCFSNTKLLVTDIIEDKFDGKVIYVQSFGKEYNPGASFISYPSLAEGKIVSCHVNYNKTIESIPSGVSHSIQLFANSKSLGIEKGSILYVNQNKNKIPKLENNSNNSVAKQIKIKELKISIVFIGKIKIKKNSLLKLEFKFFTETFQVVELIGGDGFSLTDSQDKKGEQIIITLVPTYECYFENLWSHEKSEFVTIRGQNYSILGIGKIRSITYNTK